MTTNSVVDVPAGYDPSQFPAFAVAADIVLATVKDGRLQVLLVERGVAPFAGCWALPGGFVLPDETSEAAAARELLEETGIFVGGPAGTSGGVGHLEQLGTYSAPDRDPRMRVVSVAYVALLPNLPTPAASTDAAAARFFAVDELDLGSGDGISLAFDHATIVADAVDRIRGKLEWSTLAAAFCDEEFTISELRHVYEAVWGCQLDPANFHRKVLSATGFVTLAAAAREGGGVRGRPAQLYRRGDAIKLHPPIPRPAKEQS